MSARTQWVLLAYRIPREPSTPRIAVWRRLKRLGVAQLGDGLVALPLDARTREQLEWVADEIRQASGEAMLWLAQPASAAQEQGLATQLADARSAEYLAVISEAESITTANRRTIQRLRRELRRISRRDYFPPPERAAAKAAIDALAARTQQTAEDREASRP
jgi:uncharacterized membrane protein YdfJ with MMPL/SSD domain